MPKQTLLEMTQSILSALSSDEVNSIGDTTESVQVANIIKRKYFDIVARSSLPEHEQLIQLNPSNDPDKPTLMYVPDEVNSIKWIKYFNSNTQDGSSPSDQFSHDLNVDLESAPVTPVAAPGYCYVSIVSLEQFMDTVNSFNPNETDVGSFTFSENTNEFLSNQTIYYKTAAQPKFCTIISNWYVLFDSYDSTQDDTLQSSKTMCLGQVAPHFHLEDDFIPDMDDKQFPLLLNEALALAYFELKQAAHPKAEKEINRQWSSLQKNKSVANKPGYFDRTPDFGRRGPTTSAWYGNGWYRVRNW